MRERPIVFSAPMVRAILAGTKTQTRRPVKYERAIAAGDRVGWHVPKTDPAFYSDAQLIAHRCPYGVAGDRLWVREAWTPTNPGTLSGGVLYRADFGADPRTVKYRPSIHMPRWASRISLEVTGVRVERLQDISEADAIAEGCPSSVHQPGGRFANENYAHLWDTINGDGAWDANPWVWVVEFKRLP